MPLEYCDIVGIFGVLLASLQGSPLQPGENIWAEGEAGNMASLLVMFKSDECDGYGCTRREG